MRTVILAVTAMVAVSYSAPAFAQVRSWQACWDLAEKSGATYGAPHNGFVRRCMGGSAVKGAPPKQAPTPVLRAEARTYSACWALAEARAVGYPGGAHRTFVANCMAGKQN
jgi:hypothetical protein